MLARKWTGYGPKFFEASSYDPSIDIQLDIRSKELVHAFMDKVEAQAQACGIEEVSIFADPALYRQAIETVRKKLATGQTDGITASLFEQYRITIQSAY